MEQCAELMSESSSNCDELGEGIVEESAVRAHVVSPRPTLGSESRAAIVSVPSGHPSHAMILRRRRTGGTRGGGDSVALWFLSHDAHAGPGGAHARTATLERSLLARE